MSDSVNHPEHYKQHPSGVECIEITEHMNFNLGNAVKYIWRAGLKGDAVEDLKKAAFYIEREIGRVKPVERPLQSADEVLLCPRCGKGTIKSTLERRGMCLTCYDKL